MIGNLLLIVLLCFLGQSTNAALKKVQIGIASNFSEVSSNSFNPYGNYFRDGIQLALIDSKIQLEKKGIQVELVEFDYGINSARVIEQAQRAVSSSVIAVVGYNYSTDALLAAPIHQKGKLTMLTPSATANRLGQMGEYVYSGCFSNQFMGKALAQFAFSELRAKKAAIISAADCAYCQDLAGAFESEFHSRGGTVSKSIAVLESDTHFAQTVSKLGFSEYDVILVPNHELLSARIISAILKAGIKKPFLGGDGWGNEGEELYAVIGKQKFEGYSVSHWHPKLRTKESQTFLNKYQKTYRKMPNDTSVLAYDGMRIMIQALLNSKKLSRLELERALSKLRNFTGVTGTAVFDGTTVPKKNLVFLSAEKGQFEVLKTVMPKSAR